MAFLFDAKKTWIVGGYGLNNEFERSIERIRKHGIDRGLQQNTTNLIIIEFFLELRDDPAKYRTEGNVCPCGCSLTNSGTAAIHEMFKRIDAKADANRIESNKALVIEVNALIMGYVEKENKKYIKKHAPGEVYRPYGAITFLIVFIIGSILIRMYYGI